MKNKKVQVKVKIGLAYIYGWNTLTSQVSSAYVFEISSFDELLKKITSCGFKINKEGQRISFIYPDTNEVVGESFLSGDIVDIDIEGFKKYLEDNNVKDYYLPTKYRDLKNCKNIKLKSDCHFNIYKIINVNGFLIPNKFVKRIK